MLPLAALLASLASASVIAEMPTGMFEMEILDKKHASDGYQYAVLGRRGGRQIWLKNGRVIDEGAEGSFRGDAGALADTGLLVYFKQVSENSFELHYDGKGTKAFYPHVSELRAGPEGHAAFAVNHGTHWMVMTPAGGMGPFSDRPEIFNVFMGGKTLFRAEKKVYLDRLAVADCKDSDKISAGLDGKRLAVVSGDGFIKVDGTAYGPHQDAWKVNFSPDGRHWAVLIRKNQGGSALLLDGQERPSRPYPLVSEVLFRPGDAAPHWKVDVGGRVAVESLQGPGPAFGGKANHKPFMAWSPSGKHYVILADGELIVDGESRALSRHIVGPLVFDDENEFHALAWGDKRQLVLLCGAVRKIPASKSVCVRKASALYARPRRD